MSRYFSVLFKTSSPNGNDAHLRAIIQSEKKWKHQFSRRLRATNSVVRGRIWPNFKLVQAPMYVIIIIIISIFKEDNVFSITASLSYGPPVNTDIDYYRTFFGLVYFCKCCEDS